MALGWVELVIISGLGCGCVVLPLTAAVIVLLVIHQGKRKSARPPA